MSVYANTTSELWQSFMKRRNEIHNRIGTDLFSVQVYNSAYFHNYNPATEFEKWAAVEVNDFETLPAEMEKFIVPRGLYAVFPYKGLSSDTGIFQYIFGIWLPGSAYLLDDRPHFEILGSNYKNNDPDSEEEIWIPVKTK